MQYSFLVWAASDPPVCAVVCQVRSEVVQVTFRGTALSITPGCQDRWCLDSCRTNVMQTWLLMPSPLLVMPLSFSKKGMNIYHYHFYSLQQFSIQLWIKGKKLNQIWNITRCLLTFMPMESQVKICSPLNISGVSKHDSILVNSESRWGLVLTFKRTIRGKNIKRVPPAFKICYSDFIKASLQLLS